MFVVHQQLQTTTEDTGKTGNAVQRPVIPATEADIVSGPDREPRPEVLVVEDDENEVQIITRAIRRRGMTSRFKIVRSGEDALAYLDATKDHDHGAVRPKVVLLDLKLGGIGGHEVLQRIRADDGTCTIPVVVLSSTSSADDICRCYRLGANSFVRKPTAGDHPGDHVLDIAHYWLDLNRPVGVS